MPLSNCSIIGGAFTKRLVLLAIVVVVGVSPAVSSETDYLDWAELVVAEAQGFEDPYRNSDPDQLSTLISLVRLQEQLESGSVEEAMRPRIEARIVQKKAELGEAGIDIAWLLEQRWAVAERRREAALAVNPHYNGADVQIGGFLILAPPAEEGVPTAYLVPERGMCAHVPPPPPNQLLRLVLSDTPEVSRLYEPVIVKGQLVAEETKRQVFVVDGAVQMWSAWSMNATGLETISVGKHAK